MTATTGSPATPAPQEPERRLLDAYVRARNGRRSATAAADGFVSGKRVESLRMSVADERRALEALADWAERTARTELGLPPVPQPRQRAGREEAGPAS